MNRTTKFVLRYAVEMVLTLAAVSGVILGGRLLFSSWSGLSGVGLFDIYLRSFPVIVETALLVGAVSGFTNRFQVALSMGSCRWDYYRASQLSFLLCVAGAWVIHAATDLLLGQELWAELYGWDVLPISRNPAVFILYFICLVGGSCIGLVSLRRPKLGSLLAIFGVSLLAMALFASISLAGQENLGDLPWLGVTAFLLLAAVLDWVLYRQTIGTIVR